MPDLRDRPGQQWRGYVLAVLAAICWATGGLVAKWLFGPHDASVGRWLLSAPAIEATPAALASARAMFAAVVLAIGLAVVRPASFRVRTRDLGFLAVFGVAGLAGMHVAYFQAIAHANVATAILLEYLAPVIVLVFSVLVLGHRPGMVLPAGVIMSVTGCALVVGAFGGEGLSVSTAGLFWGLTAAAFFSLYTLLGSYAAGRFSPWTLLVYGLGFATVFWLVYLGGPGPIIELVRAPAGLLGVVYLAVFATIVPFAAFLKALHYIDGTKALIASTLEPAVAALAAFVLFAEHFTWLQIAGGVLILGAILVVQRRPATSTITEVPPGV